MDEMNPLSDLLDLQELDLEIDRLLHRRETLPELERYHEVHDRRESLAAEHERLAGELRVLELELDKQDGELGILEQHLQESETRLFAGGMSARETENKRVEVESLRGRRSALEERVLALLDRREGLQLEVDAAAGVLAESTSAESELEAAIAAEWKVIDADIARLEARKRGIVEPIAPETLSLYEQLRRTKQGVAIGRLEHGVCGGCHLALSHAEQAEVAAVDPPRCIHCRRLLVL
ncbi:MAG: hypothetical protein R6X29_11490 [Acidimicrobiia bacterium]|jgi:uncharacterized protein